MRINSNCISCGRDTSVNIETLLCSDCHRSEKLKGYTTESLLNEILIRKDRAKEEFKKSLDRAYENGLSAQELISIIQDY